MSCMHPDRFVVVGEGRRTGDDKETREREFLKGIPKTPRNWRPEQVWGWFAFDEELQYPRTLFPRPLPIL